jgi:polyisoprenoid-binding protein YceI
VIARVGHAGGISFSTFRFGTTSGSLSWNNADPAASKVTVTVDMSSIQTPVANFAAELAGDRFLKTSQYHDATFVSTGIRRTGATSGVISGTLTFMGQSKPVTIDAVMVGNGMGRSGPVMGFSGTMRFKRSDFGFSTLLGVASDEIEVVLDAEFDKTA